MNPLQRKLATAFAGLGIVASAAALPGCSRTIANARNGWHQNQLRDESVRVDNGQINWAAYGAHMKTAAGDFVPVHHERNRRWDGGYISFHEGEGEFPLKILILRGRGQTADIHEHYFTQSNAYRVLDAMQREGSLLAKPHIYENALEIVGEPPAHHEHYYPPARD